MLRLCMIWLMCAGCVLAGCAGVPFAGPAPDAVYIVRHAEKEPGHDPDLSPAGRKRAAVLVDRLEGVQLTAIYTTQTKRARQTAAPIAQKLNLPILHYDSAQLSAFAEQLRARGGRALVVGHSNTVPKLVGYLGGEAGSAIDEASEYDRLYVITFDAGESISELQRYGQGAPK